MDLKIIKDSFSDYLYENDATIKSKLLGKLWYVENPNDVPVHPYGIFNFFGGNNEYDSMTEYIDPTLQITLYDDADDPERVQELGMLFDTKLHSKESEISIPGFIVLSVLRVNGSPRESKTNLGRWQHIRDFKIHLQFN